MPLALDFTWTAPDTCPTRAEVVEQLSKAVDSGSKELPPLVARAVVQQDGATWRLELETELDGRHGTRLLEADSCEGLTRAATLVLALTLGEGLARRQAEAEARAAEPPPPPPPPPPKPLAPQPPPPPPLRAPRMALWAGAGAGADALGAWGPGFALGVAYQPHLLRLQASAEATLPRSTALVGSGGDVRSFSFSGDVAACVAPTLPPLQLAACAGGGVTLLEASGHGTARDSHASVPLYELEPSVDVRWLLGRKAFINLDVASRFFVVRPELVVEGLERRRRIDAATVSAELGVGVRW